MEETSTPATTGIPKGKCHRLVQQKLSRYWALPDQIPPEPNSIKPFRFMDLPLPIRQQIYRLVVEFEPGEFVTLNYVPESAVRTVHWMINNPDELSPPEDEEEYQQGIYEDFTGEPDYIPSLFSVSRTVRNEVRAIYFSESVIAVSQSLYGGLRVLEEAGPLAWRELRTLVVRLQPCHCIAPMCTINGWPAEGGAYEWGTETDFFDNQTLYTRGQSHHNRCLKMNNLHDQNAIAQWERICAGLAAHAQPDRLQIFLACSVPGTELAKRIVQPLYSLPRLKNVAISFGAKTNEGLGAFAESTVRELLETPGQPKHNTPFRFLDLPAELQVKILEYTPLANLPYVRMALDGPVTTAMTPSWTDCCTTRFGPGRILITDGRDETSWPRGDMSRQVFCKFQMAAYSQACQRYPMPCSWFTVSRQFGEVAQQVFYSKANFVVQGWSERWLTPIFPSTDADEARCAPRCFRTFLRTLGFGAVRRIRTLNLNFPPIGSTYLTPESESWAMWLETLDILEAVADLPRLQLTVSFMRYGYPPDADGLDWTRIDQMTLDYDRKMLEAFKQIFEPMKRLRGLKSLFIYLSYPWRRHLDHVRRANEQMLERSVMGQAYDSKKRGKPDSNYWIIPGINDLGDQ
ncbi:hypothetical protein B0T10DRAFT_495196 [Thelonectria olida]|uniref:Uncharacterized protein n=1 Tax=Thelonectria olida TaxID=1576542 RepID=A0A9P8VX88_9HYPO|nr:hypothetical protein B0T10DRAFT_495196 [Thelonectria olida]